MKYSLAALFFFLSPVPASASHTSNFQVHPSTPPLRIQWSGFVRAKDEPECHSFICDISSTRDPIGTPSNRFSGFAGLKTSALKADITGRASVLPGTAESRGIEIFVLSTQQISAAVPEGTPVRVSVFGGLGGSEGDPRTTSVSIFATTFPHRRPGVSFGLGNFSTSYIVLSGPLSPPINGLQFGPVDGFSFQGGINIGGLQPEGASHQSSFGGSFRMELEFLGKALRAVSGNGQSGRPGAILPEPLKVRVVDSETGQGVDGVSIGFSVSSAPAGAGGAGPLANPVTTSGGGFAETRFRLGDAPGTYQVRALCAECIQDKEVFFSATARKPAITLKIALSPDKVIPSGTFSLPIEPNTTRAEGEVLRGGIPDASHRVLFSARSVPASGGHDHGEPPPRPLGKFSQGECTTDAVGRCAVSYTAGELGGEEVVVARSAEDPDQKDEATLAVRVPFLEAFGDGSDWLLTGDSGPTTVSKCSGKQIKHAQNHFALPFVNERLQKAIQRYQERLEAAELPVQRLQINDMSLAKGGLFDICSDWKKPHGLHREGRSVDINRRAPRRDQPNVFDEVEIEYLTEAMSWEFAHKINEGPIHYEFSR